MSFEVLVKMFFTGLLGIVALGMVMYGGLGLAGEAELGTPLLIIAILALLMYLFLKTKR